MKTNQIIQGDALEVLKTFPEKSINMLMTSPPYFNQRDYGIKEQLGLEKTPEDYVNKLCNIFDQVKRVLRDDGTCWVNISDCYGGFQGKNAGYPDRKQEKAEVPQIKRSPKTAKSLLCVPEMFLLEMVKRGWLIRNKIIWHKNNVMPSCLDSKTKVFIKRDKIKQIEIKDIKIGDLILSPTGWKKVKNKWKIKKTKTKLQIGNIGKIIVSNDHRFAISHDKRRQKINHIKVDKIRTKNKKGNYNDYFIFKNMKNFFNNVNINKIDIIKDDSLTWFVDIKDIKEKFEVKSPSNFARKIGDKSLRKVKYNSTWSYASDTHNELRRGRIKTYKVQNYNFNKIRISNSYIKENRYYKLDYDLGWLLGLYTAEGGFNQLRGFQGKITLNKKEKDISEKFKKIFKKKFGHPIQKEYTKKNYRSVLFTSGSLYSLCKNIFIKGKCKNKSLKINNFLNSPTEFREGFVKGYFDGDGHTTKDKKVVASASEQLIKDAQLILATLGKLYSTKNVKQYDKRNGKIYKSSWLWSNSYLNFNENDLAYSRLIGKKREKKEIEMIDIEVEDGLFLIENGLISHNSARDRFTIDYEMLYFFVKQKKYYFEQQFEPIKTKTLERNKYGWDGAKVGSHSSKRNPGSFVSKMPPIGWKKHVGSKENPNPTYSGNQPEWREYGRNKRTVWNINTKPSKVKHFAIYPEKLIETPIKAGCPFGGIVLDPFFGSGTTGLVALKQNKKFIGIELNKEYIEIAKKRLKPFLEQEKL